MRGVIRSVQMWHWAQLVAWWAVCLALPWRVPTWGDWAIDARLQSFLSPDGSGLRPGYRAAGVLAYDVLPLVALAVTVTWLVGRCRSRSVA
jgi:hypothetical protein